MNDAQELPVTIHRCVVASVDRDTHTCTLITLDDARRRYENVPWATPLSDQFGNGIDVGPAKNYICYAVTRTSNLQSDVDDSSVIIAWEAPSTPDATYGKDRESLSAGDVKLSTRRGGRLLLAANSGDVILQSGPANSIVMYRLANLMEVLCDQIHIDTLGGQLTWGAVGNGLDEDGVYYDCHVKSKVGDEAGFVRFYIGEESEGDVAHFRVMEPTLLAGNYEAEDASDMNRKPSVHIDLRMTRSGRLTLHARESMRISATNEIRVATEGVLGVACAEFELLTQNNAQSNKGSIKANNTHLKTSHTLTEVSTLDFKVINRATGELLIHTADPDTVEGHNKRLITEDVLDYLFNHTHPTNNGPTLAPLGAPPGSSISEQGVPGSAAQNVSQSEEGAKERSRSLSLAYLTLSQIVTFLSGSIPGSGDAIAQGLIAVGALDPGSTGATLIQELNTSGQNALDDVAMITANSAVELVNGNLALTEQEFGVAAETDIMTKDTKVR